MQKPVYDIRDNSKAISTLVRLTNVSKEIWNTYSTIEHRYDYYGDLVEDVVKQYGNLPKSHLDWNFIFSHITTSANGCRFISDCGILDLKKAYNATESELKIFLDEQNILIDLKEETLSYNNKQYNISFGDGPPEGTEEYFGWRVGRKFFFDYAICGFLSIDKKSAYGGRVHKRPEILYDIDKLLNLRLSEEWAQTHKPYEIVAQINGEDIANLKNKSTEENVLYYLACAYEHAFHSTNEIIIIAKNNVQIPKEDIISINPLQYWI